MPSVSDIQADQWESLVLNAEGPVVVDFWHQMCGWCLKLNPEFEKLPETLEGVKFLKVNILDSPENRQIAMESGVMGTPTIKVFCDGRDVGEIVGYKTFEDLVKELRNILGQMDNCLEMSTPLE